jgi:hypothetical protein
MSRIAPTTIPSPQKVTVNLKPDPALTSRTTALIASSSTQTVTTATESVEASRALAQLQQLRRWISGIYQDAKAPLATAKKTLDGQEKALLGPLAVAEARLMVLITGFQAELQAARMAADAVMLDAVLAESAAVTPTRDPLVPTTIPEIHARTTYGADVVNFQELVLAVAAQRLLDLPGATAVTRRWLRTVCQPTPQATLDLLQPSAPAINGLARALKADLAVPGVAVSATTTLVAR